MSLTTAAPGTPHPVAAPPRLLPGVSVVLPCFNEAESLPLTLDDWRAGCSAAARTWELIVVDDGSTDDTAAVALAAGRRHGDVRVVPHPRNRGYGAAVRSGFRAATLPWTFLTDGDGQFAGHDLARTLELAPEHDAVAGYRVHRADGPLRRLNGWAWSGLIRATLGIAVRDVDCAFKLIRTDRLAELPLTSEGAMISAELLARLQRSGARIAEVPVGHHPRFAGHATGARPRVVARAFRELRTVRRALTEEP